ncbi:MAG: hypothetical protein ABUJ98_15065 [Hyphomicrobium sp.]
MRKAYTPTARPDLSERACFLTVPFQATVKSLSSPFEHALGELPLAVLALAKKDALNS